MPVINDNPIVTFYKEGNATQYNMLYYFKTRFHIGYKCIYYNKTLHLYHIPMFKFTCTQLVLDDGHTLRLTLIPMNEFK